VISESSKNAKDSQCFKCQGCGHVIAQCLSRNLLIRETDDDEIETTVHEPTSSATDSDDDVRVSRIQLSIVRCSHTAVRDEGWCKSSVFHTYITHDGKNYNLMIDEGSCANIIANTALEKIDLKVEPYPHPTTRIGLIRLLNLFPSIIRSLSTCQATRIVFGVMS